jgi:hypothetical protein
MLLILVALYYGPRYLVKVGLADFGDFLVILLIQAKVNVVNDFHRYHKRLPEGSVRKIQEFLRIFPILSDQQRDILSHFIDDSDVEGFLCKNFGSDYQRHIDKYESMFRKMLSKLLHYGLTISPLYTGRYACSCAKWVVVKSIFSIISDITPNVSATIAGKQLSPNSARIAFSVSVLQNYGQGDNYILNLYLNTINDVERTGDGKYFFLAEQEFNRSVVTNEKDHQEWMELHAKYHGFFGYSFALYPKRWDCGLISSLMNDFVNHADLLKFIEEVKAIQEVRAD